MADAKLSLVLRIEGRNTQVTDVDIPDFDTKSETEVLERYIAPQVALLQAWARGEPPVSD